MLELLGNGLSAEPYPFPGDEYLGEVLASNFVTGTELATLLGFSNGIVKDDTAGWLQFKSQEGVTFFVAKKTLRYRLSWNQLETALIVYGARLVNIRGNTYKVRLLRGAEADPTAWVTTDTQENPQIAKPSEWNRFIHRVASGNPTGAPSFANFSLSDLSIAVSGTGRMTLCQETLGQTPTQSIARGNVNLSQFNYVNKSDGTVAGQDHYGWRPVLELVGATKLYPGSGPGQQWLQAGDEQLGYFGEVAAADMITNANLKTHLGLASGSVRADQGYLKFFYKGKVVFIGKNTFATSLTWNQLYAAGGIYGTKDNGRYPATTPVNQYKPLVWQNAGKSYRMIPRAMTCAPEPFENSQDPLSGNEYSDLMGRLFVNAAFPGSGQWGRYTAAQLNMNVVHMGPETRGSNTSYAAVRGYSGGTTYTSLLSLTKADASGYSQHFRMVLEIEGDPAAEPGTAGPAFWLDPSDQAAGSTTIVDKSLKAVSINNSGVVVSDQGPRPGVKSMFFDKSSVKYLRMPGSLMPNVLAKDFQIDYWFKPDGTPAGTMGVITQWAQSSGNAGFLSLVGTSGADAYLFGPYNSNTAMITAPANANHLNWVKRSIRRQGSNFEYWQDDVLVGTFTSALTATKTVDWIIGSYMNSSNIIPATGIVPLGGWIADLRVYDFYKGAGNDNGYPYDEYQGEVAATDFITAQDLTTAVGVTEGVYQNDRFGWLKFRIDGKTLMVGKRSIRYNLSWNHLNSKGVVDGTKTVVIDGKAYKVRLLKGAEANPSGFTAAMGQANPQIVWPSEWNRLIMRVAASNPGGASNWATFTDDELNVTTGSGCRTLCQETMAENGYCIGRGFPEIKWVNYQNKADGPDNSNFVSFGWRPVLELVE